MITRYTYQRFKCRRGHVSEILVEDSKRMENQKCGTCGKRAEHHGIVSRREAIQATIVYEKVVDGKVERMYVDPQVPESCMVAEKTGFQKREIQGMAQARAFEKEVANEMRREFAAQQAGLSRQKEAAMAEAHSEIRRLMPQMDDFSRAIAEEAIRDSQSGYSNSYDPNFRIGAYS